jgi:hypothetical protein
VFGQTTVKEAYFHELRGMEDSSGVTHLFYRMYKKTEGQCSENNGGQSLINWSNNINHFDTEAKLDTVKFNDYFNYYPWCVDGMYTSKSIFDFTFIDQDPKKWIKGEVSGTRYSIIDYKGQFIEFFLPVPTKTKSISRYQEYFPRRFFLSNSQDSLFINTDFAGALKFPGNSNDWPNFEDFEEYQNYTDSVAIEWDIIAQHPFYDSLYFARGMEFRDSSLYRSEHSFKNFSKVSSEKFTRSLTFDGDNSHIYSFTDGGIFRSNELGASGTWNFVEIDFQTTAPKYSTITEDSPGEIILSDSTAILFSENHGDSFSELLSVEHQITGLYKKPNSDILYVLTKEELLEVNTETKTSTSLKQLPVSSEQFTDVPTQITLEQNYPNPFNPSTVIRYQLDSNQLVRLEVFDVTGRKVAVLVDGVRKSAGSHRVSFDGSGLSSGVYFYRLEAGGQTITHKMLLVK